MHERGCGGGRGRYVLECLGEYDERWEKREVGERAQQEDLQSTLNMRQGWKCVV